MGEPAEHGISEVAARTGAGRHRSSSHHQPARRAAHALAALLSQPLVDVPGNHLGPSTEPAEFARALLPLLGA